MKNDNFDNLDLNFKNINYYVHNNGKSRKIDHFLLFSKSFNLGNFDKETLMTVYSDMNKYLKIEKNKNSQLKMYKKDLNHKIKLI